MYQVYILRSLKYPSKHYTGYTTNIAKRIMKHNSGKTKSLKYRRPLILVYYETFESRELAKSREKEIKGYKGGNSFI